MLLSGRHFPVFKLCCFTKRSLLFVCFCIRSRLQRLSVSGKRCEKPFSRDQRPPSMWTSWRTWNDYFHYRFVWSTVKKIQFTKTWLQSRKRMFSTDDLEDSLTVSATQKSRKQRAADTMLLSDSSSITNLFMEEQNIWSFPAPQTSRWFVTTFTKRGRF